MYFSHTKNEMSVKARSKFMTNVFGYMFIGVVITAIVAWFMQSQPGMLESLFTFVPGADDDGYPAMVASPSMLWIGLSVVEFIMVVVLVFGVNSLSSSTSWVMFLAYAALNGVTLTPLLAAYSGADISMAFISASSLFAVMSVYAFTTKSDFSNLGSLLVSALIAIIISMIANWFIGSSVLDMAISAAAIVVSAILVVYDIHITKKLHAAQYGQSEGTLAIYAALGLYLDFKIMFVHFLRFFESND